MTWVLSQELQSARRAVDEAAKAFLAGAQSSPSDLSVEQRDQLAPLVQAIVEAIERSRAIEAYVADESSWVVLAQIDRAIEQTTGVANAVLERLKALVALGFDRHAALGVAFWRSWIEFRAQLIVNRNANKARSDAAAMALSRMIPSPLGAAQIWADDTARFRREASELNARPWG